jgi:hypothetical protein
MATPEAEIVDTEDVIEPAVETPEVEGKETPETPEKPDELRTALADLASHVQKVTAKEEPKKELSEDEKNEYWGVYDPEKTNPDFFKKWMRIAADMDPNEAQTTIAERKALFAEMQKGLVRQAVVGARNLSNMELEKLRGELKPVMDYYATKRSEETRDRFYKTYESLSDPKYSKVVDATARTLADKEFKTEEDYFKALAEGAAEAIKGLVPDFDLGAGKTKKPAATTPKLPRTTQGGSGGAGGGARKEPASTEDQSASVLD